MDELPSSGEADDAICRCAVSAHDAFIRHAWACALVLSPSSGVAVEMPRIRYME